MAKSLADCEVGLPLALHYAHHQRHGENMDEPVEAPFTAPDVWRGGFYELEIVPRIRSSQQIVALLSALWSFPSLDGCYLRNDCVPSKQPRCKPYEEGREGHLYGMAELPGKGRIVCGSYAMNYAGEDGSPPAYRVGFYFPLGALSEIFPVGAYPFGAMSSVPEWRIPIDEFLRSLAEWIFRRVPFDFAIIGFEIGGNVTPEKIRADGIPHERPNGILWNEEGELKWFGPNRP